MKIKKIYAIVGPTAVGKTNLGIKIAKKLSTEIISADSRQCYKELNIGISKPSENQLKQIKHHFINALSIQEKYSVGDYEKDMTMALNNVFKDNNHAVVVGGSGLFVKALLYGLQEMPTITKEVRKWATNEIDETPLEELQEWVAKIDPEWARGGDMKNPRRLQRILEVWKATGKPITYFQNRSIANKSYDITVVYCVREKNNLYERIEKRADTMIQIGLFDEVAGLRDFKDLLPLRTVGYQELFPYFEGKISKQEAIILLKQSTKQYAKRQMTWFKKERYDMLLSLDRLKNPIELIIDSY